MSALNREEEGRPPSGPPKSIADCWVGTSWKMTKTLAEARAYVDELVRADLPSGVQPFLLPAHTALAAVRDRLPEDSPVLLGVQNAHWAPDGEVTGEISMRMAADAGARIVEIGHSDRRMAFAESDLGVAKKVAAAVAYGLTPLVCVGEPQGIRQSDRAEAFVEAQLTAALSRLVPSEVGRALVAYEPVWAVGSSGRSAHPEEVGSVIPGSPGWGAGSPRTAPPPPCSTAAASIRPTPRRRCRSPTSTGCSWDGPRGPPPGSSNCSSSLRTPRAPTSRAKETRMAEAATTTTIRANRLRLIVAGLVVVLLVAMILNTKFLTPEELAPAGPVKFDPKATAAELYEKAKAELPGQATDLGEVVTALQADPKAAAEQFKAVSPSEGTYIFAVRVSGMVSESGPTALRLQVDGVPNETPVQVPLGTAINGTVLRDALGFKFADAPGQTGAGEEKQSLDCVLITKDNAGNLDNFVFKE